MNTMFNVPNFTKRCQNCQYKRQGWFTPFEFARCDLSGHFCTTERSYPSVCGIDFERWKPSKVAFREMNILKKDFPEYFV